MYINVYQLHHTKIISFVNHLQFSLYPNLKLPRHRCMSISQFVLESCPQLKIPFIFNTGEEVNGVFLLI